MKSADILYAMNDIDPHLITDALTTTKPKFAFRKLFLIAACFVLLFALLLSLFLFMGKDDSPLTPTPQGKPFDTVSLIEAGDSLADDAIPPYQSEIEGGMASYAYLTFDLTTVIEAEVIEVLPDSFISLDGGRYYKIAHLLVIDSINCENLPEEIYLRYDTSERGVQLEGYDSFLFSLDQVGIENHLMFNANTKQATYFPNMFIGSWAISYGSAIAFTDGKVDLAFFDRIFDHKSNPTLDEMREMVFDNPDEYKFPVDRESTIEEAKERIASFLEKETIKRPCDYLTAEDVFSSDEAKVLQSYLAPSKGSLFTQNLSRSTKSATITYTRVINGFSTNEVITIDVNSQTITEKGERFTQEDLSALPDLVSAKKQITLDPEHPPHVKLTFGVRGSVRFRTFDYTLVYRKINGQVYGIIRADWVFTYSNDDREEPFRHDFRDDVYFLYNQDGNGWLYDRDSLQKILGEDSIIGTNRYFDPDNGIWWH